MGPPSAAADGATSPWGGILPLGSLPLPSPVFLVGCLWRAVEAAGGCGVGAAAGVAPAAFSPMHRVFG